jgi:heat shock protein HslJ
LLGWTSEGTPQVLVANTDLTIQFNQGEVNGSGGCNSFMGRYAVGSNQISMGGPVATTRKACPPGVQDQEDLFIAALRGASGVDVTNQGNLRIAYTNAQGSGVLIFQPPRPAGVLLPTTPSVIQSTPTPPVSPVPALW